MNILIALIVFSLIIFFHELGHFAMAKKNGVLVREFSIGMGPKILGIKKGETLYSLRLLPLGGFVNMLGENTEDLEKESEEISNTRSFINKSIGQRFAIIFAGPFMNFVSAIVIFIGVFMFMGIPSGSPVIGDVLTGGPAESAGILPGDRITMINGVEVQSWNEMIEQVQVQPEQDLTFLVERSDQSLEITFQAEFDEEMQKFLLGVYPSWEKQGFFTSIGLGFQQAYLFTEMILVSLVQMITGQIPAEVAGPVGIVDMVGDMASMGMATLLLFAGILSINLGVINLFPIPALDGSRLAFLILEKIRKKPLDRKKEAYIHLVGFVLLMLLMVLITYKDILRIME